MDNNQQFINYLKQCVERDLEKLNELDGITNQDLDTVLNIIKSSKKTNNNSFINANRSQVTNSIKKSPISTETGATIGTIQFNMSDLNQSASKINNNIPKYKQFESAQKLTKDFSSAVEHKPSFGSSDTGIDEERPIASVRSAAAMFGAKPSGPPPPVASKPAGFSKANLSKSVSSASSFNRPQPAAAPAAPSLPSRSGSIENRAYPPPSMISAAPAPEPALRAPPALPTSKKPDPYLVEAVAEYDFSGEDTTELSFQEGQTIFVTEYVDDQWWKGRCEGKVGMFPRSYVKEV